MLIYSLIMAKCLTLILSASFFDVAWLLLRYQPHHKSLLRSYNNLSQVHKRSESNLLTNESRQSSCLTRFRFGSLWMMQ